LGGVTPAHFKPVFKMLFKPNINQGKMMQIKILSGTTASGTDLLAGTIAEVSDQDGETLIRMGKAELYTATAAPKKSKKKE
tara:strand:- start:853 stop:1095 length:243 start_codon:yes stop_codon:yes gene_type:complete